MKKTIALLVCLVLMTGLFTGCSGSKKESQITLNVFNWGEYIDESVLDEFTEQTGIRVQYTTFGDTGEEYSKLKSGGGDYDVIFSSDFMINRMIEEGMLEELDLSQIPNFDKVDDSYKGIEFDPENQYSVPYMSGTVGIIYNKSMVSDPVTDWDILWNEKYQDQILMFTDSRDAFGVALKKLGYSYNTTDTEQIHAAAEELKKQKPLVQAYVMDQMYDKMISGEAAIGVYYAGDCNVMIEENPDLAFVLPQDGTNFFIDAMCIVKGSKNKDAAAQFINFMCEPEISAKNCDVTCYSTPITEARDLLDTSLTNNETIYPSKEYLASCETYLNLPADIWALYDKLYIEIMSQ